MVDPLSRILDSLGFPESRWQKGKPILVIDPLSRAERTPEAVAVSGYTGQARARVKSCPGIPQTNLKPSPSTALAERAGTPSKPTDQDLFSDYLDYVDKLLPDEAKSLVPSSTKNCGLWAIIGECVNCHRFATRLFCGKPYCDICREIIHQRKIGRGMPYILQIDVMGKLVIRPPDELQPLLWTKRQRAAFTKRVADAIIKVGYVRLRWFKHDFGEKSTKYAFHLEVIVDGGHLPDEVLDELKRKLRRLIYPRWVIRKWGDTLDIWYNYYQTPAEKVFALTYATHPTFTNIEWDRDLARELNGERYSGYRGNWKQPAKWQLTEHPRRLESLVTLEQGKCPTCGEPIVWNKRPTPWVLVLMEEATEITAGYYELSDIRPPPPGAVRPTNLIELLDGDPRKKSNLVKRHGERVAYILSLISDYES